MASPLCFHQWLLHSEHPLCPQITSLLSLSCAVPCTELPGLFCVSSAGQDLRTLWCTQTSTPPLAGLSEQLISCIQHLPHVCWRHPVSFSAQAALQQAMKHLAIDFIRSFPFPETTAGNDHRASPGQCYGHISSTTSARV